jgi:formylglycine-generating enzyme required for sulfatase activity
VSQEQEAHLEGSGAAAQGEGVAAGERGVAVGGGVRDSVIATGDFVTVIYQGTEVAVPSPEAVARHRAALRERLEADACARWGGMSVYIQEEGAALPIEASPYQMGRLGPRENLLGLLHAADRLLVLGEPGSGKTVSLERLAWELCSPPTLTGAPPASVGPPPASAAPGQEPAVPVLVRLFHYAGTPLAEWVRATLQETGHLRLDGERALAAFLKREGTGRCFFLFDGLNEVPPPYRDRLVDELVRWMAAYPRHPVVLTSRAQDELWRRLREEVGRAVVVQPIGDEQARAYLVAHLGERGEDLYGRLDQRLRAMARTPLILWLIKEAGAAGESVPGNRGELYAHFVSRMLRRDTDRRMDAEIQERVKRRALAGLAYHLGLGQRLACPRDEAVDIVARQLGEGQAEQADQVVGACARHGLLAGDDPVWFAPHQMVQEHFAALALREVAQREWRMGRWARLRRSARRLLSGQEEGLARLAADDWWMETFVQLAGLLDEADRLALDVVRVNPWLAWWCVEEGRGVAEETREAVADRSVRLLESEQVADRRRAVAALARVQSERVVHPLFRAAADPDVEVAGLAAQALIEMGEAARAQALALAQQPEHSLHRSGLAYLDALLGQPMVWVPPGPFLMGSNKGRDPQAFDDELPQHEVTLPGYWIGRCPVTVAQFRAFVEASGHRPADPGSLKGPGDHPVILVTWHEALAFCRWLSERAGLPVTLPSEAEWEKAARGTDGHVYPWEDEPPDEGRCNFGNRVGETTPVGRYSPQGDSPYGCADMAGNVWEWTRSLDREYPYDPGDGREDLEAGQGALRVLRGGAFSNGARFVRCAYRLRLDPNLRYWYCGFRLVASPVHL